MISGKDTPVLFSAGETRAVRRQFGTGDALGCPRCGGRLRVRVNGGERLRMVETLCLRCSRCAVFRIAGPEPRTRTTSAAAAVRT